MTVWLHEIDLKNEFSEYEDTGDFDAFRTVVVEKFRNDRYCVASETLMTLVDELAGTSDPSEFDEIWAEVYDYADQHSLWIAAQ